MMATKRKIPNRAVANLIRFSPPKQWPRRILSRRRRMNVEIGTRRRFSGGCWEKILMKNRVMREGREERWNRGRAQKQERAFQPA